MEDLARDLKANRVDDVVTVVVAESASAVATGATKTSRKSSINSSITALAGQKSPTGAAVNLAAMTGDNELDGSGTTSRTTTLTTSLTARVTHVLPNGFLVVEGFKEVQINSEWQTVTVRGIVRPADLGPDNSVVSQRLAQLEVKLDGKGVVNDAIRRPGLLYRLLMGILPF
jgi:flagellar L-ring protein precursor FlgH